ncbi:excalibur calcium-binding domain-containing protein [Arthrobacter sp. MDT2-16]
MKKTSATIGLAAAVGFTALSALPAMAATPLPFENCGAAAAVGVYNIPVGSPGYGPHLNRDGDATGCDEPGTPPYNASIVDAIVAENNRSTPAPTVAPTTPPQVVTTPPQVTTMPNGAANTGVTQETSNNTAALALGGGLVLAAAAGGTFVVRRRVAGQA